MLRVFADPAASARLGFALCLPFLVVAPLALAGILPQPGARLGPLGPWLTGPDGRISDAVPVVALLLALAAMVIAGRPLLRHMRAGGRPFDYPVNLVLAGGILVFFAVCTPLFVIDQYPCWIGVPNCD